MNMQDNRAWLKAINAGDRARKAAFVARLQRPAPADEIRDLKLRIMALESSMKGETDGTRNTTD